MTIDLSHLSQEKRAFLKANPDLLKSLEKEIPLQAGRVQARKEKLRKGKAKWQRDLEDVDRKVDDAKKRAEELRRKYDPKLMEINRKLLMKAVSGKGALVCPVCGDSDHGNKMNGKPWCFKCKTTLVPKDKLEDWLKLPKVKVLSKSLKDEFKKQGLDF